MFRVLSSSVLCSVGVLLALSMVTPAAAISVDGSVFEDQFDAALSSSLWYLPYCTNNTIHDSLVDIDNPGPDGNAQLISDLNNLGLPDPTEWGMESRFEVPAGAVINTSNPAHSYAIWLGYTGTATWSQGGINLGFAQDASGESGSTYSLSWGGAADPVAIGLNKGTIYTTVAHRKSDGNVDIYLDDVLVATRPVFDDGGGSTPTMFGMGDGYGGDTYGRAVYDYVKVGNIVPEPSSVTMLIAIGVSLLAYAWRRRR